MGFDRYFDKRSGKFSHFYGKEALTRMLGRGALFDRLGFAVAPPPAQTPERVLDVGCGSGPLFEPLASHGMAVTGLEPAPSMIELATAKRRFSPGSSM